VKGVIAVAATGLLLTACASGPGGNRIGSLQRDVEIRQDTAAPKARPASDVATVGYSRFVKLFESVPQEDMRRDGVRRLARLQLQADSNPQIKKGEIPLQAVTDLFESLLEAYPQHRNDRLLYQLAKEYDEAGQQDAALRSLDRLVQGYPDSVYFAEAQFRRGEILFVKRAYHDAQKAYAAVIAVGRKTALYEQAIYKKGWSLFKQSQYTNALDEFLALLDIHIKDDRFVLSELPRAEREFVEDVLRASSLCFSYQAGPASADEYLSQRRKRVYEPILFEQLAEFYLQKKHYADSVKSYQAFVARDPLHPQAPLFLMRVIEIYDDGGFSDLLIAAKKDFVQRYGIKTEFWASQGSPQLRPVVLALQKNLKQLATHYHTRAQKTHSRIDYREAQRWYRTYLSSFPEDPDAAKMNFLFAEILFEDKQYADAVLQYEKTAYDYKDFERSAEAGYAALITYNKHEAQLDGVAKHEWHRRSIDSALRFAKHFPQHPKASEVLTQAAENLYNLGEYEKGHKVARQVVVMTGNTALEKDAWVIMGHIEFIWQDFTSAEMSYRNALKHMAKADPEYKALVEKQAVAVYKQGEVSREKGDLKAAVRHFSRVKQYNPGTGIVANAEYDQAAALIALRDWAKAALVLETFRREHPKHALHAEATKKLAVVYMEKGDDKKAAAEFERISKLPGEASYQLEALWQAAELYEQASDGPRAQAVYKQFVKRFPSPVERAVEARQRLVELYRRDHDDKSMSHWYREIVKADAAAASQRTDRTRYLAAKASFALAEPLFEQYRKVELKVPLKKSLASKKTRMDKALKAYGNCAAYEVPEVLTASTYRIAEIYQDLGLAIYNSERPKKLNAEELEQYDVLLEEQAYPFEEKAIEFHEINAGRMSEGFTGVWVQKSLDQLKELLPVRYAKQERREVMVNDIY
jgi:TolA-binding protein